eukprot:CAMPEP_0183722022 /NCGR_PEP_ID=MMETSP0737-20130205/14100_1 /TAXON_ID=385413 /ORGANISM="Thalassiosira miniscula, Strain CCMP1093" /LENGTH=1794 /DNA_ID=CAMNT_0025952109 /DNA_START=293 /DNA_END=5677 /DNA_ORIENTATION=+
MKTDQCAAQDPLGEEGKIPETILSYPTTCPLTSTKKNPSIDGKTNQHGSDEESDDDLTMAPLCVCPSCDKVLASIKSLYGHFGRSHRTSINQGKIKYACPFCDADSPGEHQTFGSTTELGSHVDKFHPDCTLLIPQAAETSATAKAGEASRQKPSAKKERRRSTRNLVPDDVSSSGALKGKPPKQKYSHPLCKCPECTKILLPPGLFGHFGRVHSGQLGGETARFDWKNVTYACPFCPDDLTYEDSLPHIFQTIELLEEHVGNDHANCHLTRPNALNNGSNRSGSSSAKPDFVGSASSMNAPARKSQRSRRSSAGEGQEDADGDNDSDSPNATTRKSQRSRRSVENVAMVSEALNRNQCSVASSKQQRVNSDDDDSTKPLYNCPDCDKKNLTKHGLHAHYGMKHGGSVDMSMIEPIATKIKKKEETIVSRTGPWTEEEHEAFLRGHAELGNRWKQISVEYVPSRDAKQIGSHALNYFSNRGEWKNVASRRPRGGRRDDGKQRRPKKDDAGISAVPMDVGDKEADVDSIGSSGSNAAASDKKKKSEVYDDEEVGAAGVSATSDNDDGNSSHCIVCFEGGNIVCCSKCPRAYHPKCLAKDGHGNINVDLLPNDWQCNRCKKDFHIVIGSAEEISQKYAFGTKKIRSAYAEFKDCSDYNYCCALLSNILDILSKLQNYDYGYVFSEPVDVDDVPDYLEVVHNPMDYGTVSARLEGGNYVDLIHSDNISREDENSTMEEILLLVLCDIERVHHNCKLYNKKGSSIYRIGDVHSSKWNAYFSQYIVERLPENVQRDLTLFRHRCDLELKEENHSKRLDRSAKTSEKLPTTPSKSPSTANQKKRKASETPSDEKRSGEDAEDDEEEQQKPKAKKAKQEDSNHVHSSALLFTEDQMRSLENVFFTSVAKLREEFDELDACSALTSLLACSPSDNTDNPSGAEGQGGDDRGNLTSLKSEENLEELRHNTGGAVSPRVPEMIISGPTTLEPPVASVNMASCSTPMKRIVDIGDADKVSTAFPTPNIGTNQNNGTVSANNTQSKSESKGTTFQRQWYERLNELKKYKVMHGTAVVSATSNDKLYHWRLRQRKRYHLTLFRMPHLKKDSHVWESESGEDKNGKQWLLAVPEMKGVFSLIDDGSEMENTLKPFTIDEKDIVLDETIVYDIRKRHQEQLYCPRPQDGPLISQHSSRHSNSLFWDECLEELRFFEGEHKHTIVPRDFPHNRYLPVWVEIQRARYLLQNVGLFSGLTGWQMFVLDELNFCDLSSLPTVDFVLGNGAHSSNTLTTPQKGIGKKKSGKTKTKDGPNSPERKTWSTQANDFREWFQKLSTEEKPKARELLSRANWPLYSWCWRQCNASSAALCMTPTISGINMSVKKLNTLASYGFFHAFPYNDRNGLVCEDDYEGCEAFDLTFQVLEDFSIKYGSTHIPDWYECDRAFRMWVLAVENGLHNFVKGEPCILSSKQIEKLILIGFCNDRDGLPNLSRSDVVWLKMFAELKRHLDLFGDCNVSSDFPYLHQWIAQQKELFRLSRMGNKDMMNPSRLKILTEVGVDFFTGECLPDVPNLSSSVSKEFELLTSSPVERFPEIESVSNNQTYYKGDLQYDHYWVNQSCKARLEQLKAKIGHSIILASDDTQLYFWLVEQRGKLLLTELSGQEDNQVLMSNGLHSLSLLKYITVEIQGEETGSVSAALKLGHSMFLWLHYCERLMMFKARNGHCKIPKEYPDIPLRQFLARQRESIHLYSTNQPTELLPVQLKILHSLGLHGSKRESISPKLSTRTLKRKNPSRKDKKYRDTEKTKKE